MSSMYNRWLIFSCNLISLYPIWYFFVLFWVNWCVFLLSVLLWVLTPFSMLPIHSVFCYVLLIVIFYSKIVQLLLHPVVGKFSCHLPQFVGRNFFCFGMSCFLWIVLLFVIIFFIFLLLPVVSGLFPQVVLLFCLVLLSPFCPNMFQRFSFCFIVFACFHRFFYLHFQLNFSFRFWFFVCAL